jgi:hypothetical protein
VPGKSVILVVPVGLLLLVVLVVPLEPTGVLPVVAAAAVPKHSMVEMARLVESILHILLLAEDRPGQNSFLMPFRYSTDADCGIYNHFRIAVRLSRFSGLLAGEHDGPQRRDSTGES